MPISNLNLQTGGNFAAGAQVLSPMILEMYSQREAQIGMEDQSSALGFVPFMVYAPSQVVTSMIGPTASQAVDDDETLKIKAIVQGYEKSYNLQQYGNAYRCTKVLTKWIEAGASGSNLSDGIKAELEKLKENIEALVDGDMIRQNIEAAQVYAKGGLATSAFGAGSPAGDGVALFSTAHVVKSTGATYSNRMAAGKLLTATTLEEAIQKFKTEIKMDNGYSVKTADVYTLYVGRALEVAARKILNSTGAQAGMFAGTGSNSALLNTFNFQGSKVELVVIDMLGEPDGSGVAASVVGGDAATAAKMWFLTNKAELVKYRGLRRVSLPSWNREVRVYQENNPAATYAAVDNYFAFDHFGAHPFMVGYLGD